MKKLYKLLDIIFTPLLYLGVLYIMSSIVKYVYVVLTKSIIKSRIIIFNHIYLYEIIIIILCIVFMVRHIRLQTRFKKS